MAPKGDLNDGSVAVDGDDADRVGRPCSAQGPGRTASARARVTPPAAGARQSGRLVITQAALWCITTRLPRLVS